MTAALDLDVNDDSPSRSIPPDTGTATSKVWTTNAKLHEV